MLRGGVFASEGTAAITTADREASLRSIVISSYDTDGYRFAPDKVSFSVSGQTVHARMFAPGLGVSEDPATVIRSMPDQISHVHLEDIGSNRVHQHLTPGKGAIDFRSIFSALNDIGYTGWVTVELYPYETTAAGVAKLAYDHLVKLLA